MGKRKDDEASIGHNQDVVDKKRIEVESAYATIQDKKAKLTAQEKDLLNDAKDNFGILKGGVKKAFKKLRASEEKRQADEQVDAEAERIHKLCEDLPLFHRNSDEDEEAA